MTTQLRFDASSPEGRLLAAGRSEAPSDATTHRAARRLGLSAAVLGVAAASTPGAAASAPVATSLFSATFVKAVVIGVGAGVSSLGAVELTQRVFAPTSVASNPSEVHAKANFASPQTRSENRPARDTSEQPQHQFEVVEPQPAQAAVGSPKSPPRAAAVSNVSVVIQATDPPSVGLSIADTATPPANPQLSREIASVDLARSALSHGAPSAALREIDSFNPGYRVLGREAMLVRIDALLALGRKAEAGTVARRLLDIGAPAPQRSRLEQLANASP